MIPRAIALARTLLRRRAALVAAGALLLFGALGGQLPLLDVPGYELGEVGAWLGLVLGPPLGWWAAAAERERGGSPAVAGLAAALASTALLALLFLAVAVRAALGPCRTLDGAGFFPVLALPSAWLAAALSGALAWPARRGVLAAGLGLCLLASLGATLHAAWRGPAAFALDHLLGVWPGPLYDEALRLDARILLFRAGTVALAVAVGAAASAAAALSEDRRRAGRAALALALAVAALVGVHLELRARVLDGDRDAIAAALGGRRDGPACALVFPAEWKEPAVAALAADCEFHAADVAAALGLAAPPRVTVFVHRSDEEKRRHVGAGATSFTKPWLREIHLTQAAGPPPALRHELVHAVAAALEPGWLGVPARDLVVVSAGLVEGLAVALEVPRGSWTIHEWSAALRDLGLAPDLAGQLGPAGFWSAAPARAYTAAGSLLAWLLEHRGSAAVARLYRTGDFEAAFGRRLPDLVADWEAFLAALPRPHGLAAAARARFARPALFAVPCAREVASLEARAWVEAGHGQVAEACARLRRVSTLTGRAGPLKSAGDLLARSGALDEAEAAYREAARAAGDRDPALVAALLAAQADLAWRRGEPAAAAAGWLAAGAAGGERQERRLLEAKLAAVADPTLSEAVRPWLLGTADAASALGGLERLDRPLAAYLAARAHLARGEAAAALPLLRRAAAGPLPGLIALEDRSLLAEVLCLTGETAAGAAALEALRREATGGADQARAEAGLRRCAFEAARR